MSSPWRAYPSGANRHGRPRPRPLEDPPEQVVADADAAVRDGAADQLRAVRPVDRDRPACVQPVSTSEKAEIPTAPGPNGPAGRAAEPLVDVVAARRRRRLGRADAARARAHGCRGRTASPAARTGRPRCACSPAGAHVRGRTQPVIPFGFSGSWTRYHARRSPRRGASRGPEDRGDAVDVLGPEGASRPSPARGRRLHRLHHRRPAPRRRADGPRRACVAVAQSFSSRRRLIR